MSINLAYVAPFFPIVTRGILMLHWGERLKDVLSPQQLDKETHRTYIMGLAGFSFSGLLALVLVDATLRKGLRLSIYYLLLSFLGYLFALNTQSYKAKRWHDQLATTATDMASFCLVLSIVALLLTQGFASGFSLPLSILAVAIWAVDHIFRIVINWNLFKENQNG